MPFAFDKPWKILVAILVLLLFLFSYAQTVEQCNQGQLGACAVLIGGK